jgi:hypothetical protein
MRQLKGQPKKVQDGHDAHEVTTCSWTAHAGQRVSGGNAERAGTDTQQSGGANEHTLIISFQDGWVGAARFAAGLDAVVVCFFAAAIGIVQR